MADSSDLSSLSDDQLKQLHLQSLSDDDLQKLYQPPQDLRSDQSTPNQNPSASDVAIDVAKQAPSGIIQGIADIPTAIPRMLNAAGPAISSAVENVVSKFSPEKAAEMHDAEAKREALVSAAKPFNAGDYLPSPQTKEGQYARTAAEFVPGMMTAPGSLVRNAATGVGAGLASEGAGQATAGTAAEPYARVGAGVVAGLTGAGALTPKVGTLTPEAVKAAGSAGFESPAVKNILISPVVGQNISDNVLGELDKARFNDRLAPTTRAIVGDFATPIGGMLHSVEDYQTTRQMLGKVAGNYSNPIEQAAASQAIASLDKQFGAIKQSDLVSGDIAAAHDTLTNARANYAAGSAAERVQQKLDNAELQAASAHSGGNIDNATRQKLRPLLTNPSQSRGLTPDELDQLDQVVRGSPTGNVLRATGKILGGGGGLGSMVSAAEGMHLAGPVGAAAPIAGYAVKKIGDALTKIQAAKAVQQILNRAPAAANLPPTAPGLSPLAAMIAGGRGGAMSALNQSQQQQQQLPASQ